MRSRFFFMTSLLLFLLVAGMSNYSNAANSAEANAPAALSPKDEIIKIDQAFVQAIIDKDYDHVSRILSDKYKHIHASGATETKETYLLFLKKRLFVYWNKTSDVSVDFLTPDIAILIGVQRFSCLFDGKKIEPYNRYLRVYSRDKDGWKMETNQSTSLK